MKLKLDEDSNVPEIGQSESRSEISLPQGLFGFAEIRSMELVFDQDELPFMWLREQKQDGLAFIVLEPGGIIPNYSVEISDADVKLLGITGAEDTMILNIELLGLSANFISLISKNFFDTVSTFIVMTSMSIFSVKYILFPIDNFCGFIK